MAKVDLKTYAKVLAIRQAWQFDIGTALMRMYGYMFTIGTVTMLTLSGFSALFAGTVSGVVSVSSFVVAPRVGKLIDRLGQRRVVPFAGAASILGVLGLVGCVVLGLPLPAFYVFAILMGAAPNPQALARTRWTYLVRANCFGAGKLDLRTAFSFEGVIDEAMFMISPALNIAIAATVHPVAGMAFGAICELAGLVTLVTARKSEPQVGWMAAGGYADGQVQAGYDARFDAPDSAWQVHANRSAIRLSGTVRVLFTCMVLVGLVFGSYDPTVTLFCQYLGDATLASPVLMLSGFLSAIAGMVFGMIKLKGSIARHLLITGTLYGLLYAVSVFIFDAFSLVALVFVSAPWYAPFLITMNTVCEKAVPDARLTESLTWMNAGSTVGFAIGPTVSGMLMDVLGGSSGFILTCVAGVAVPLVLLATRGVVKREAARD